LLLEEQQVEQDKINYVVDKIIGVPKPKIKSRKAPTKGSSLYFNQKAAIIKDQLLRNTTNFKLFMAIYYNDFKIFNYTIPKILTDL
jgi:hypothetical protein